MRNLYDRVSKEHMKNMIILLAIKPKAYPEMPSVTIINPYWVYYPLVPCNHLGDSLYFKFIFSKRYIIEVLKMKEADIKHLSYRYRFVWKSHIFPITVFSANILITLILKTLQNSTFCSHTFQTQTLYYRNFYLATSIIIVKVVTSSSKNPPIWHLISKESNQIYNGAYKTFS